MRRRIVQASGLRNVLSHLLRLILNIKILSWEALVPPPPGLPPLVPSSQLLLCLWVRFSLVEPQCPQGGMWRGECRRRGIEPRGPPRAQRSSGPLLTQGGAGPEDWAAGRHQPPQLVECSGSPVHPALKCSSAREAPVALRLCLLGLILSALSRACTSAQRMGLQRWDQRSGNPSSTWRL